MGLVVAFRDGIYLVQLQVGARLRVRRLTDGRVRCMSRETLTFLLAEGAAHVIARRPGRFAEMPCDALVKFHDRLQFKESS